MPDIFVRMLEVTAVSSAIILTVFIFRALLAKRTGPGAVGMLWALVLLRLCLPFTLESPVHLPQLIPQQQEAAAEQPAYNEESDPVYVPAGPVPEADYAPGTGYELTPGIDTEHETVPAERPAGNIFSVDWLAIAAYTWLAGAAAMLLGAAWKGAAFGRRVRRYEAHEEAARIADGIRLTLRIRRNVPVKVCADIKAPVLFGLLKPQILLPESCRNADGDTLRCILAHELCHVKRHDILKGYIWLMAKAAHWFNPFVWLAYAACRDDTELCCDDMVLRLIGAGNRFMYTQSLIDVFRSYRHALPASVPLFEKKPKLTERVMRMLEPGKRSKAAAALSGLLALIMLAAGFTTACSSAAETANMGQSAEAYEAPGRWTDSFKRGTLQVYVDADVIVPDGVSFPTYETDPDAVISQEAADKMIKTFFGEAELYQAEVPTKDQLFQKWHIAHVDLRSMQAGAFDFPDDWDEARKNEEIEKTENYKDTMLKQRSEAPVEPKLVPFDTELVYDEHGIAQLCCYAYLGGERPASLSILNSSHGASVEFENNGGYNGTVNIDMVSSLGDLTISEEDAKIKADGLIKSLGLDGFECAASYITSGADPQSLKENFAHAFVYTKNVAGIPAAAEVVMDFDHSEKVSYKILEYQPETILVNVNDKGVCDFKWDNMFNTGETTGQNAKLMSFDKASDLIRQKICRQFEVIIDSYSNEEGIGDDWRKMEKYILYVDRISLEYARMPLNGGLDTQVLAPVWSVYASNEELTWEIVDGEKRLVRSINPLSQCILTVNAIDGKMIGEN